MDKLLKECQVMAESTDVIVESLVLSDLSKDKTIRTLELGAGSGGWPRIMTKLGATNIDWILLEDFSWVNTGYATSQYYWPYDKEDFLNFMHQLAPGIYIEELIDRTVAQTIDSGRFVQYENSVAAVRIDCDITIDEAIYLIENCLTDTGVVIIDDCRINCGLARIMLFITLIQTGYLFPVWFGSKEAMLCKNKTHAEYLQNLIAKKIDDDYADSNISYNKEYKIINNTEWNFITTNNFKVFTGK